MMRTLYLTIFSVAIVLFSGCSTKKVFEPAITDGNWKNNSTLSSQILDINSDVAKLEGDTLLLRNSTVKLIIEDGYRVISKSENWIISSTIDGDLRLNDIDDADKIYNFALKKTVATASTNGDMLAVLFADNEMAIYSISTKELFLREQGNAPKTVDSRMSKPHFMNDLVIFLTLDGKVVIINSTMKKKLRTVIVSSEDNFNNIISFKIVDEKIIVATATKMLSLSSKENRADYEIRDITYKNSNIYLATKQGEIISLTPDLQLQSKLKFPFAHFLAIEVTDDKVILLEKEGYIIEVSLDLKSYNVYDADFRDGYVFSNNKTFFIDAEKISIE